MRRWSRARIYFDRAYQDPIKLRVMAFNVSAPIQVHRLVANEAEVRGTIPLDQCPRLAGVVAKVEGETHFELRFCTNGSGRPAVVGEVSAIAWLQCQRCTEPYEQTLRSDVRVEIVDDLDADSRQPGFEPMATVEAVTIVEIVETELLLAMPAVPVHAAGECEIDEAYRVSEEDTRRPSPFAALKELNLK